MSTSRFRPVGRRVRWAAFGLCFVAPMLMGGCPEFRNEILNVANTTVQGLVFGELTGDEAADDVTRGVLSAAIDALFDQLRDDSVR